MPPPCGWGEPPAILVDRKIAICRNPPIHLLTDQVRQYSGPQRFRPRKKKSLVFECRISSERSYSLCYITGSEVRSGVPSLAALAPKLGHSFLYRASSPVPRPPVSDHISP